ncbi:MAG: IS21 family transposase [Spirochaetota bacterium]|nr:MAG: IS21 family transposase [Spirochaetota bacterium]
MVEKVDVIRRLRLKQSIRSIHRETGVHRTIIRELRNIALTKGWLQNNTPLPSECELHEALAQLHTPSVQHSHPLDTWKEEINRWVEARYSYVVIHQLVLQHYQCSEATVRRYIQRHFPSDPQGVMVRSTIPGEAMEVDFGFLGITYDPSERRNRKTYLFSGRLRHSRIAYRERVFDQTQQTFFEAHIHAFEYFGGVAHKVVPDNLKAAVVKASFEDPVVNRAYQDLACYYGFLISPCLPYSPRHKGGVENDIKYVKNNFWPLFKEQQRQKGREIPDAEDLNTALEQWTRTVSESRIIKGVGRSPREIFQREEQQALHPLPPSRWDPVIWAQAKVQENWRIQFQKAFYSVPYRYIGKSVLVMANTKSVHIFFDFKQITTHRRATRPWEYVRKPEHAPPKPEEYMSATRESLLIWAAALEPSVALVARAIFSKKGVDALRPVRALLAFEKRYGRSRLNRVCERALLYDTPEYQTVKSILKNSLDTLSPHTPIEYSGQRQFRFARETRYFDPDISHTKELSHG